MKNFKFLLCNLCAILLLFLSSCGIGEWSIDELHAMKIEGTSKILYKYFASGGRDSMVAGYLILDSTETFKVDLQNNLEFHELLDIPNQFEIKGITTTYGEGSDEDYNSIETVFKPVAQEKDKIENMNITTYIYQYKGYAERTSGYGDFEFDTFKETRDSIYFYNLNDIVSLEPRHLDTLKIKKTNIVVRQDKNFVVKSIVINDLVIDRNKQIISNQSFNLTPKNKLKTNAFSDYGIFKEIVQKTLK